MNNWGKNTNKNPSRMKFCDSGKDRSKKRMMKKPKNCCFGKPTMPYKLHIQFDHTRNYMKHLNIELEWARVVNRKTYDAYSGMPIEDLDITPDIPTDVLVRPLPDGVTYIKTVFEYGGMPNIIGTNGKKNNMFD